MPPPVNWNNVSMLTPGMKNLGNQFNRRWINRDGTSDGAVGDYAHQQENSGHNPDDTKYDNAEWDSDADNKSEIRAIDVDDDLNDPSVDMQMVIDHMRNLPGLGKVIRYMIYNRKIYKASNNFNPETYTGVSAHTEHAHFSGAYSDASDENTTFDFKFDELGDEMTDEEFIAKMVKSFKDTRVQGALNTAMAYVVSNMSIYDKSQPDVQETYKLGEFIGYVPGTPGGLVLQQLDEVNGKLDALTQQLEAHFTGIVEGTTPR